MVRTSNTAVVCYINYQGGLHSRPLYRLVHQILWFSLRTVHIPGHLNMGADILSRQGPRPGEWMLHPEEVRQTWRIWPGSGGPVCNSRDIALSPLFLSDPSSSTGAGCQGTDVAKASSVHLSPITQKSPVLAGPSMLRPDFPSRLLSVEISIRRDLLSQAEDTICPPLLVAVEVMDVTPEGHISQLLVSQPKLLRPSSNPELPLQGNCPS